MAHATMGGDGCSACIRLQEQIDKLTATVRDQARALAEFADDVPPWAPSLSCVYWLYGPTRWSEPSWPKIAQRIRPLLRDVGDLPAQRLTPVVWAHHMARRKTEPGVGGKPPKDLTLNFELQRTKEMLSWAVANKMLKFNPLAAAKPLKAIKKRDTFIKPDNLDDILAAADDVVDRRKGDGDDDGERAKLLQAFLLCCFDSMLRFREAMGLRHDRIAGDGRVEVMGKGRKKRIVFLTPRTMDAIATIRRDPLIPHVFTYNGSLVAVNTMRGWFWRATKTAGSDALAAPGEGRLRVHDLRASGATTADERGARLTAIRDTLGHSSLAVTEIYMRSPKPDGARHVSEVMTDAVRRPAKKSMRMKKYLQRTAQS